MSVLINIRDTFIIGDPTFCAESPRTIDIKFVDLATNKELLEALNLVSIYAEQRDGITFFASYLSAFTGQLSNAYLLNNPTLRILILDDDLREKVKKILNLLEL